MPSKNDENEQYLGFLSVTGNEKLGLVGGFLILNEIGRPIEFHCTAPVRPNRAQEILYGDALSGFLYGEQISQTLIKHAKSTISIILTDCLQVLLSQSDINFPIIFVFKNQEENDNLFTDMPAEDRAAFKEITIGKGKGILFEKIAQNFPDIETFFEKHFSAIDPIEPFERIRNAIEEAQKSS